MARRGDRYGRCESCDALGHLRFTSPPGEKFSWICVRCRAKAGHRLDPGEVDHLQAEQFTSDRILLAAPPADISRAAVEALARDAQGQSILIIEDDADTRNAASAVLGVAGFSVLQVANGKEALDLLATLAVKPRLILLDLWMPIMSGWDFYEHVSRDRELRTIPVVVLTAYDLDASVRSLKWLRKPIGMDTLLEAVRSSFTN